MITHTNKTVVKFGVELRADAGNEIHHFHNRKTAEKFYRSTNAADWQEVILFSGKIDQGQPLEKLGFADDCNQKIATK
jgi:hypothetical protein